MTISNQTAKDVAEAIYKRFEALGVTEAVDPLALGLGLIEDVQREVGNKSFSESMGKIHRAFKEAHLEHQKKNPGG